MLDILLHLLIVYLYNFWFVSSFLLAPRCLHSLKWQSMAIGGSTSKRSTLWVSDNIDWSDCILGMFLMWLCNAINIYILCFYDFHKSKFRMGKQLFFKPSKHNILESFIVTRNWYSIKLNWKGNYCENSKGRWKCAGYKQRAVYMMFLLIFNYHDIIPNNSSYPITATHRFLYIILFELVLIVC